jgi:ubiquinone/menaquinone biosynthesis C-methylase UbiE/acyl carrier protein
MAMIRVSGIVIAPELILEILDWIRMKVKDPTKSIHSDTNLIEGGILDSVGFLDLVELIEGKTGLHIDLAAVDYDQLTSVDGLCGHLATKVKLESRSEPDDRVIRSYSEHAQEYAREESESCWGRAAGHALDGIRLDNRNGLLVEVGCGTGRALVRLAPSAPRNAQILGIEPAPRLREIAAFATDGCAGVRIIPGRFEDLPLETRSVDYLFSLHAFHWTTDLDRSIDELARVIKSAGELDLIFTGRHTGEEFTAKTTPIFLQYMGVNRLLESTDVRVHLTCDEAREVFERRFDQDTLTVEESSHTYFDTLENHWSWFVSRASAHFVDIPAEKRAECEAAVRNAIEELREPEGIPYTVHTLHVRKRT